MATTLRDTGTGEAVTLSPGPVTSGLRLMRLALTAASGERSEIMLSPTALRWLRDRLSEVADILP
ncbi:MAG TPA: hypothetical protein VJ801_14685 [Polyangia bacterium]|jgi:hypothetical protein|nr:hypothetical protein [Polyangia bacterium]